MIGGNIDGFISCIERGVSGVRVPAPEINQQSMERKGDKILKTRQILFDCSFCKKFSMGKCLFRGHDSYTMMLLLTTLTETGS